MSYQCFVEGCPANHVSKHEVCTVSSNLRSLLDEAIGAMSALHESAEPLEDHPEIPALIPAQAFRTFVDAHARLLYGRAHLPVETSAPTFQTPQFAGLAFRHWSKDPAVPYAGCRCDTCEC